jgi:hypothetical protein
MIEQRPPSPASQEAGYELRDVPVQLVAVIAVLFVIFAALSQLFLWQLDHRLLVPQQEVPGASPPIVMPGEAPVNQRLEAIRPPRLDPLVPLREAPPSFRSSQPVPGTHEIVKPWDLWPDHQKELNGYGWVKPGQVAHIPINEAMDVMLRKTQQKKPAPKPGDGK